MSEDQDSTTSSLINEDENDIMEANIQAFKEVMENISTKDNKQTKASGVVFQELLRKLQQLNNSGDDRLNRIRQGISLSGELIDTIEKATSVDMYDFQNCYELLYKELSVFESITERQDEKLFVREIFFAILDLLSKPQIHSYLNHNQQTIMLHKECYKFLTNLFVILAGQSVTYVPFVKDDIATRKYTNTLCAMCNGVKYDVQQPSTETKQPIAYDNQTIEYTLSFLWNLADRTIVVQWFLGIDFVKVMLECLKRVDLSSETARKIIGIIYNISRHDDGADELNQFDGPHILRDILNTDAIKADADNDLTLSMATALLSTSEQIRSDNKRMNKILNQLLQITIDASEATDHRAEGFHVSEPLAVFTKLFVDDHSLEYVLSHAETEPQLTVSSTIALFVKLLIEFRGAYADKLQLEQFTCMALLNIFWSISFQQRYKTKLQQNKDLLKTIKSLAMDNGETVVDQYIPGSMESMTKAANGILYNLNEGSDGKEATTADTQFISNDSSGKPMVMISYAHDNNPFCDKILTEFEKNHALFDVWIDRDHCSSSEDLWEKIARGIRQSNLVICLLSQDYFNSKSCRKEANFAIQRKKAIIPVYIDEPGDCDWLDIHIAGLKYVRFKNYTNGLDRGKVQELLTTIQATIKETQTQPSQQQQQQTKQHVVPPPSRKDTETIKSIIFDIKKPPEEWTTDDIHNWFDSHKVPDTLVKLFDFQSFAEMHEYSEKLRVDPKKEFVKYEQQYAKHHGGDTLEEYKFNRFKNALLSLTNRNSRAVKASIPSDQTSRPKSSACILS